MIQRDLLIGKSATIINKKTSAQIKGMIVDETQNTLTINGKYVIKNKNIIIIGDEKIDGSLLQKRPQDRIKSKIKTRKETKI